MTLPSGGFISFSQIGPEMGRGYDLNSYRGQRWFLDNNGRGYFPGGTISFSDFFSKRGGSPVQPNTVTLYSSQNVSIPMFNNMTVTVVAGRGGQGGNNGNCAGGGYGGNSGGSYLSDYVGVGGGSGGAPGGNWGSQPSNSTSLSIDDSNQNSIIALYGQVKYAGVGGGGGGGATGYNSRSETVCSRYDWVCTPWGCVYSCVSAYTAYYCDVAVGGGSSGGGGYVQLSWY